MVFKIGSACSTNKLYTIQLVSFFRPSKPVTKQYKFRKFNMILAITQLIDDVKKQPDMSLYMVCFYTSILMIFCLFLIIFVTGNNISKHKLLTISR